MLGAQLGKAEERYDGWDAADSEETRRATSFLVEGRLALSIRLGDHLALGVFGGFGHGSVPVTSPEKAKALVMATVGPQLTLAQGPYRGLFLSVRAGGMWLLGADGREAGEVGPSLGASAGYFLPVFAAGSLGFGADFSARWYGQSEDGDHGEYTWKTRLWTPAAVVTLRVL